MQKAQLGRAIMRLSPLGRAVSVGWQLMDLWQMTQPEQPAGWNMDGWSMICSIDNPQSSAVCWSTNNPGLVCGTGSQVYDSLTVPGSDIAIPATMRWISIGLRTSNIVRRMRLDTQWYKESGPKNIPWQDELPQVTQPMPGPATPPAARDDPYPQARPRPRPDTRPKPGPRTKPAPYNAPPGQPPHRSLPYPGEKKYKFPGYGLPGQIYGGLTELKDHLKCAEKATKGHKIPKGAGLAGRAYALAQHLADRPQDLDGEGLIKCLIANHAEDAIIGKANQLANRITGSPYWTRPGGVGLGNWAVRMG